MAKKNLRFLLVFALFAFFFLKTPNTANAACNNSYYCGWDPGTLTCFVDNSSPDYCCTSGYHSDPNLCASFTDIDSCQIGSHQCIQDATPPPGYNCTAGGQCNPAPDGSVPQYDTYDDCIAACTGTTPIYFNCDPTNGCTEAQGGVYDNISECNKNCQPNMDMWCNGQTGQLNTAIGCIPILDQAGFINFILKWAIGIGAGIAFMLSLYAGFIIMTASGNPERIKAGKELLTSAIAGLMLIIFAVFVLNFIGVDILGIFPE